MDTPRAKFFEYRYALACLAPLMIFICWCASLPAQASHNFDLDLGGLGEIHVNHDSFGHRTFEINDRGGDSITGDRSFFGPSHNQVHVLGNDVDVHGGQFGNKSYSVNTMFGDKFQGQRNLGYGHRGSQVDLQGRSQTHAANHVFGNGKAPESLSPLPNATVQSGDRPASEKINKLSAKTSTDKATEASTNLSAPEKTLP